MRKMHFKDISSDHYFSGQLDCSPIIHRIIADVKQEGDKALKNYTYLLDKVRLDKIEVKQKGKVRRSKLYYLRSLAGRAARISEKREWEVAREAALAEQFGEQPEVKESTTEEKNEK